jgi:hypothetical protein
MLLVHKSKESCPLVRPDCFFAEPLLITVLEWGA